MSDAPTINAESELVARLRAEANAFACGDYDAESARDGNISYDVSNRLREAAATIERLASAHEQMRESLVTCESTLQLCSERIASDSVAMNQIVDAFDKQKPNPNLREMKAHQEKIDRYVFKAIDDARKLARQA